MSEGMVASIALVVTVASARAALRVTRAGEVTARLGASSWIAVRPRPSWLRWPSGAEHRRVVRELPDVLEDVARSLRSGTSLRVALAEAAGAAGGPAPGDVRVAAGGARGDIAVVVERADRGEPLVAALDAWTRWRPLPEVRLVVAALGLGLEAGAASARTVDGLAATLRERSAVAGEVSAQATQARLSALVISALPLAFTTWTCLTDRRIADFLFATPAGWGCLLGGVTLNAVGALWMRRITRSVA